MATDDLTKKRQKAAELRAKIVDERTKRHVAAQSAEVTASEKAVDDEIARLSAELEAEQALTTAQNTANKQAVKTTSVGVLEAQHQAESARTTAENVAAANDPKNTDKTKEA